MSHELHRGDWSCAGRRRGRRRAGARGPAPDAPAPSGDQADHAAQHRHGRSVLVRAVVALFATTWVAACSSSSEQLKDAGQDAKADASAPLDASSDVPSACGPVDVSGYQPQTLMPPNAPHANKCTTQQLSDYAQCQGAKITSYCSEFADGQPGQTCRECIETQATAMRWGVIVFTGNSGSYNIEGCVDDALSQVADEKASGGKGSCGDALFASYGCQETACAACKGSEFDACVTDVVQTGCKAYDAVVESKTGPCAALLSDAAPAAVDACFPDTKITDTTQQQVDWLTRMASYMCGP